MVKLAGSATLGIRQDGMVAGARPSLSKTARIILLAVLAVASVDAGRRAAVAALATRAPDLALSLDPTDADALNTALIRRISAQGGQSPAMAGWVERFRRSLAREPLDAGGYRALAFGAETARQRVRARDLMHMSERVSRRDLLTQLWLIEDDVSRGDVRGALVHHDRALSTHAEAEAISFPVLTTAVDDPRVRAALVPLLRAPRRWAGSFLRYAVNNTTSPRSVAALVLAVDHGRPGLPVTRGRASGLIAKLVGAGDVAGARALAGTLLGAHGVALDRVDTSPVSLDALYRPLSWTPGDDPRFDVRLDPRDGISLAASPGAVGPALYRVVPLAPGTYTFAQLSTAEGAPTARLAWQVTCMTGGSATTLLTLPVPNTGSPTLAKGRFVVGRTCSAVRFEFRVANTDGDVDLRISLKRVESTSTRTSRAAVEQPRSATGAGG